MIGRGHRGRVDGNHVEVVTAFRKAGAVVRSLAQVGDGMPDLMVLINRQMFLIEVKQPKGKMQPDQERFIAEGWPVQIVRTAEEAMQVVAKARE